MHLLQSTYNTFKSIKYEHDVVNVNVFDPLAAFRQSRATRCWGGTPATQPLCPLRHTPEGIVTGKTHASGRLAVSLLGPPP